MSEMPIRIMTDGIRYRKKRKFPEYLEMNNKDEVKSNNDKEGEISKQSSKNNKQFKFSKNKENLNKYGQVGINSQPNVNNNINPVSSKMKNNAALNDQIIKNKEKSRNKDDYTVMPEKVSSKIKDPLQDISAQQNVISEGKLVLMNEFERLNGVIKDYEKSQPNYLKLLGKRLGEIILKYPGRVYKKITPVYKDENEDFKLNIFKYTHNTILINIESMTIDLIVEGRNKYKALALNTEAPNFLNILLAVFGDICGARMMNSILPMIESSINKFSEVFTITQGNIQNLLNKGKNKEIGDLKESYYQGYAKIRKVSKNVSNPNRGLLSIYKDVMPNLMENEFPLQVFSILSVVEYKQHHFDFEKNPNFPDNQIKKSNTYHKALQYINQEKLEIDNRRIKLHSMKKEIEINNQELFNNISDMQIFYMNSSELIKDFLDF